LVLGEPEDRDRDATITGRPPVESWMRVAASASTHGDAATRVSKLGIGSTLCAGRFVITQRLGAGGMGVVYAAHDTQRRSMVALKTLPLLDAAAIYGLKSEFRSVADLTHPNLVRLHELFADADQFFFSMELVDGQPFVRWLRPDGVLDATRLEGALTQLGAALGAMHGAGKLHRDLKPSNVLVTDGGRVVVLDFGLAADPEPGGIGQTLGGGTVSGTPAYMAPEQAAGLPATQASDVYASGVMLFEALTGRLPFEGGAAEVLAKKQSERAPKVGPLAPATDPDLAALCDAMLDIDARARPSVETMLSRLQAIGRDRPNGARKHGERVLRESRVPEQQASGREALIGRDAELRALRAAHEATFTGAAIVVFVSGDSGMGKSALVNAFLHELRERGDTFVLAGRCFEREAVPFQGFDSVVDDLSRLLRRLSEREAAALMPREAHALSRLFPVLERVEAVACAPRRELIDLPDLRRRAFEAMAEVLGRMRDRRPVVLCVDDWQWVDRDSTLLMQALLAHSQPIPMLTIVCHRSEGAQEHGLLSRLRATARGSRRLEVREIAVTPLSDDATTELVRRLLGVHGGEQLARAASREARGSPFFAAELSRWAVACGATDAQPALELSTVLEQRVAALSEPSRRALQVLALAGTPLRVELALAAAAASHADLDELRAAQLTRHGQSDHGRTVECYHDRVREAVERSLDASLRTALWTALAQTLRDAPELDDELIARCYEGAGQAAPAARHAELAGDRAQAATAFDHAARLYRKALALDVTGGEPRRALSVKLGEACSDAGRGADAAAAFQGAAVGAGRARSLDLRRRAAEQLLRTGHASEGSALLREVCAELGMQIPGSARAAMLSMLGSRALLRMHGLTPRATPTASLSELDRLRLEAAGSGVTGLLNTEPVVAAAIADRYLLRALSVGDPWHLARALGFQAYFRSFASSGELLRCSALITEGIRYAEQTGRPEAIGFMRMITGHVAVHCGVVATAQDHYREAFELLRGRPGMAWDVDVGHIYDQFSAFVHGQFGNIVRDVPALLASAHERGNVLVVSAMSGWAGSPAWLVGDDTTAYRERLAEARRLWSPQREMQWPDWFLLTGEVMLSLYAGEPGSGFSRVHALWPAYHRSISARTEVVRAMNHWARGGCALSALQRPGVGDDTRKERLAVAARDADSLSRLSLRQGRAWGLGLRAGLALSRRDHDTAAVELRAALVAFEEVGYAMYAAAARRRLGELLAGDEGRTLLARGDAAMRAEGVVNLDAMTEMLVPGCRSD
jgi:hypothetical protein